MTEKEYKLKEDSGKFDDTQLALFDIARQLTIGNEHLKRIADTFEKVVREATIHITGTVRNEY